MDHKIDIGVIKKKTQLPPGLISRSEANQYVDVNTLTPMVTLIKEAGLTQYFAIGVNGKIAEYLNINEAKSWGAARGYDFWPPSEISEDWRDYLRTLDRIYKSVERLKVLAERMEFNQEELASIPQIERQNWPWAPKAMSLRDPRLREVTALRQEREKTVPLTVHKSLQDRYRRVRKKLAAIISGDEKRLKPLSIKQSGDRFLAQVKRSVLGENFDLCRSFILQADAIQWAREMSEELDVLAALKQTKNGTGSQEVTPGSISKILLDPTEYLKAGNRYLVEMASKVVATENPSLYGNYVSVEAIHAHSVLFRDTIVCGIYFLICQSEIVYVGQSVDVFQRLRAHRQEGYKRWDRFSMIPVREEKLDDVERWYIQHFRPKYNKTRQQPYPSEVAAHASRVKTETYLRAAQNFIILDDWIDCLAGIPIPEVPEPAFPPAALRFRALCAKSPGQIRVVILGQDPYHGEGEATGLAFSVPVQCRLPPSLRNIFLEMENDPALAEESYRNDVLNTADLLTGWHDQGVLLLNTALSVAPSRPGSHAKIGWKAVTDRIISAVSDQSPGCVFILWGDHAQQRRPLIDESRHLVLAGVHPSPLSAHRGFFGSRPFSLANEWLLSKGLPAIRWKEIQSAPR